MTSTGTKLSEPELVWEFFGRKKEGFFADVGANDPFKGSQTWFLEQQGWHGLLVEPLSEFCEKLRKARPASRVVQAACGPPEHPPEMPFHISSVPSKSSLVPHLIDAGTVYVRTEMVIVMTLDEILAECQQSIDFVSIDVEGTQYDVLRGFSLRRHRLGLLLLEDHLRNLKSHRLVRSQGYKLVKRTGLDDWYVPEGASFTLSTAGERLRLWKKVWLNTPFRKVRLWREARGGPGKRRGA